MKTTVSEGCRAATSAISNKSRSEEHTSELQSQSNLVCRLLLEKTYKKQICSILLLNHQRSFRNGVLSPARIRYVLYELIDPQINEINNLQLVNQPFLVRRHTAT